MAIRKTVWRVGRAYRRFTRLVLMGFLLCVSAAAAASDDADRDKARALAEQAGDALDARNFSQAIELVTQAEALYHAPTHLIIAAEAHEGMGALVEAAELYERIVAEPLPAGSPPAFKSAKNQAIERVRALIARIPSLLLRVSPASARAQLTVDGQPFESGEDAAKRVNPGKHEIRASAPGFLSYQKTVELNRGGVVTLQITLQREQGAPETAPAPAASEARPAATAPPDRSPGSKVPAYVAFGFGAVGLGVGAVTGKMSLDRVSELEDECPDRRCPSERQGDIDDAKLLGTISTIGFGVGAVGLGAGVVLLIMSGSTSEKTTQANNRAIEPWVSGSSLGLRGSF